jgi:ankyrin repeat protein
VAALLRHNAALEAAAVDGLTPLHVAAGGGRAACLQVLSQLVGGALLSECQPGRAAASRLAVVSQLLQAGADAEASALRGLRPLHFAAAVGEAAIVRALLEAGADPLAVVCGAGASARRTTAARIAGEYGHLEAAQLLAAAAAAAAADAASAGSGGGGGVESELADLMPTYM